MALNKRTYVANTTKITAANLNEIQDAIIDLENKNIPNTTSLDNNKFLRVVNGTPTWVALTNVAEEGA